MWTDSWMIGIDSAEAEEEEGAVVGAADAVGKMAVVVVRRLMLLRHPSRRCQRRRTSLPCQLGMAQRRVQSRRYRLCQRAASGTTRWRHSMHSSRSKGVMMMVVVVVVYQYQQRNTICITKGRRYINAQHHEGPRWADLLQRLLQQPHHSRYLDINHQLAPGGKRKPTKVL